MDAAFAIEVGSTLCVQVSLVIAATFALQRLLNDARGGCRLWTTCFVAILSMLAAAVFLPHRRWLDVPTSWSNTTILSIVTWQGRLAVVLLAVWSTGVVLSLFRRGVLCLQLVSFLQRRCETVSASECLDRIGVDAADLLNSERSALQLLVSDEIAGPFCWQLHRPLIVLPRAIYESDNETLRHVLVHEIEHLRTRHPMQHFLQGVCSTLFWFHPAIWMAARDAELTREFLCDEVAAVASGRFAAYLRVLANVAEACGQASCTNVPKSTLAFGNRKSSLIRRSERLVQIARQYQPIQADSEQRVKRRPRRTSLAIVLLVIFAGIVQQFWLPTNAMASHRSDWSPWPSWTAKILHNGFDIQVRDFEPFDDRAQLHELMEHS